MPCCVSHNTDTVAIPQLMQEQLTPKVSYTNQTVYQYLFHQFALVMWSSEPLSIDRPFVLQLCCSLTVVSCNVLPSVAAVSTSSKRARWCNSHFIHCTKIEVGDGVWGCIRARHWVSDVRGGSTSPVLHRVTRDHLTRSQCWSAPSDSELACFIQCHHRHISISRLRYICWIGRTVRNLLYPDRQIVATHVQILQYILRNRLLLCISAKHLLILWVRNLMHKYGCTYIANGYNLMTSGIQTV